MYANSGDGEAINEKFFRVQLQILKYCGLWNPFEVPYAAKSDRSSSKKYVIFSVAVLASLYYLHTLAQTVFIIKLNDFENVSDAFFITATGYKVVIKMIYFLRQQRQFRLLVNEFHFSPDFRPHTDAEQKSFENAFELSNFFFNAFFVLGNTTVLFWSVVPIYKCFLGFPMELPIPAWFPYTDSSKLAFWTAYTYLIISAIFCANLIGALCLFEFTCFSYLDACIQVLSMRLMKIGNRIDDRVPARKVKAYENVVDLMKNHLLVKRYIRHCEHLTEISIFAEISFSSLIVCMTLLKIITGADNVLDFVPSLSYLGAMTCQIFQYCFVGNEIIYSANELGTSAYFSDFRLFDKRTSQIFLMLHKNLQQEISVCTGGSLKIKLCIQTFLAVMKMAYSFLAILKAIDS